MTDSNKNLTLKALLLLAELGKAMGPPVAHAGRQVLSSALVCLSDKKKPVRALNPENSMLRLSPRFPAIRPQCPA